MLKEIIGRLPKESGFKKRMRFHQAWWRSFILVEEQGCHPIRKNESIGSVIQQGEINGKNFLSDNIRKSVEETIQERKIFGAGIIEEKRNHESISFLFKGDVPSLLRELADLPIGRINIEEPDLEEVFMHYYEDRREGSHE